MALVNMLGAIALDDTVAIGSKLKLAQNEIFATFGDTVSVLQKAKTLLKFGRNEDLDSGIEESVWTVGGIEQLQTTNTIDTISSTNAADTQLISIEGHTVTGTGVDQQFTFVVQTIMLNGQNKVTLPTPLARCSRVTNNNGTELLGRVTVYRDTTITAGLPNDITFIHNEIAQGRQQSFKSATTFSNTDYFILEAMTLSVARSGSAAQVDFELQVQRPGQVFKPIIGRLSTAAGSNSLRVTLEVPIIVPKNSDIRIQAISTANNTPVNAQFEGHLALIL